MLALGALLAGLLSVLNLPIAVADHGGQYFKGVNYLQASSVSMKSFASMQSLRRIKSNGANTVAIIAFVEQSGPGSSIVMPSNAVTDSQLIQAISDAQDIGLMVILKPQVLVQGSWAGAINPGTATGWDEWFNHYQRLILHYAAIAQKFAVNKMVIGTELRYAAVHPRFRDLIHQVRHVYKGEISYAAHGVEGVSRFPYWNMLDSVSVTLYPSMGKNWSVDFIRGVMSSEVEALRSKTLHIKRPVWIAEIGIASEAGSHEKPWAFGHERTGDADEQMQAQVLGLWLETLSQPWIHGVLIWNWFSDVDYGGVNDKGFSIQNKSAESVVRCYWTKKCG